MFGPGHAGRALAALSFLAISTLPAAAQEKDPAGAYPSRPVRIVLPFTPGGAIDMMARVSAQILTDKLGQSFVVENLPGAGGVTGSAQVARAAPDGYTLLAVSASATTIAPALLAKMPYDPLKDLQPVVMLGDSPMAVVVRRASPLKTLADLVSTAKARPGGLSYGSAGSGTAAHLGGEMFKWRTATDILHVPYKGVSPAQTDLLSGILDVMFVNYSVVQPAVRSGDLRVLAIAAEKRSALLPDLQTAREAGVDGYVMSAWNGLMAPAGTPPAIIRKLSETLLAALQEPAIKARMATVGMEPVLSTPEVFAAYLKEETVQMRDLIRAAKIGRE